MNSDFVRAYIADARIVRITRGLERVKKYPGKPGKKWKKQLTKKKGCDKMELHIVGECDFMHNTFVQLLYHNKGAVVKWKNK